MAVQKFFKYNSFDTEGKQLDYETELQLSILETSGNYLLHKDLLRHFTAMKRATASTKTRSEVRGGGRKPWQQKGTGRARAGSNRSPLWKGGGVIFGPKPKQKKLKLNKKERRLALQTLLYNKKNQLLVIEDLENDIKNSKTKTFLKICQNCNLNLDQKLLVIVAKKNLTLKLATQNIKNVELVSVSAINTLNLLKADYILLTSSAMKKIKEIYCV